MEDASSRLMDASARLMDDSMQKSVAVRRASLTARSAKRTSFASSPAAFIQTKRSAIDFQILALQAEVKVLEELKGMDGNDNLILSSLFDVLLGDSGEDMLDADVLSMGLKNVTGVGGFQQGMTEAIELLQSHEALDKLQFEDIAKEMAQKIECSVLELAQIMIMAIVFEEQYSLSSAMATAEKLENVAERQALQKASVDERMKALYKLFDFENNGIVSFNEVVLGLYKITEDIEGTSKVAVEALLVMEEEDTRDLTFEQFAKLMMNVVAAHPENVRFEDIADKLTIMAAQPFVFDTNTIQNLFAMDRTLKRAVQDFQLNEDTKQAETAELTTVEKGKAARLFDIGI